MSDDFDKNDDEMSWLDDNDESSNEDDNLDDGSFDWQASDDDDSQGEGGEKGARLGFTGALSWRQGEGGEDDDGESSSGDDLDVDWQSGDDEDGEGNLGGDPSKLGFTGMLSWRQDDDDDDEDDDGLSAFDEQPPAYDEFAEEEDDFDFVGGVGEDDTAGELPRFADDFEEDTDNLSFLDDLSEDDEETDDEEDDLSFLDLGDTGEITPDMTNLETHVYLGDDAEDNEGDFLSGFDFGDDEDEEDSPVDLSFLDGIEAEADDEGESDLFTDDPSEEKGEVYDEFAGLSDLEMLRRARTGLTDEVEESAEDDLSFLNMGDEEDGEPEADLDDLSFLDETDMGETMPDLKMFDTGVYFDDEDEVIDEGEFFSGFDYSTPTEDEADEPQSIEQDDFAFDADDEEAIEADSSSGFSFLDDLGIDSRPPQTRDFSDSPLGDSIVFDEDAEEDEEEADHEDRASTGLTMSVRPDSEDDLSFLDEVSDDDAAFFGSGAMGFGDEDEDDAEEEEFDLSFIDEMPDDEETAFDPSAFEGVDTGDEDIEFDTAFFDNLPDDEGDDLDFDFDEDAADTGDEDVEFDTAFFDNLPDDEGDDFDFDFDEGVADTGDEDVEFDTAFFDNLPDDEGDEFNFDFDESAADTADEDVEFDTAFFDNLPDDEGDDFDFDFDEGVADTADEDAEFDPALFDNLPDDEGDDLGFDFDEELPADESDADVDYADQFLASIMAEDEADQEPEEDELDPFAFDEMSTGELLADESLFGDIGEEDFDESAFDPASFADQDNIEEEPEPEIEPEAEYQDLSDLLATFDEDDEDFALPESDQLEQEDPSFTMSDYDDLFGEEDQLSDEDFPERPNFLSGVSIGDEGSSAAAYVRRLENKPDDELDDQLYQLRQRGMNLRRDADEDPDIQAILPGVGDTLREPNIRIQQEQFTEGVQLSDEQQREVEVLQGLVSGDEIEVKPTAADVDAIDFDALTEEDIDLSGFVDAGEEIAREEKRRSRGRRRRIPVERVLIALLLVMAVLAPFFGIGLFGNPPPDSFEGGEQAAVFEFIGTIDPFEYVLFGVDYGPTNAAELDPILKATVKHTIAKGGYPVFIGRNPIGISRAQDLMDEILSEPEFADALGGREIQFNEDYFIIGFLPGGEAGLSNLANNTQTVLATNIGGQPTGLEQEIRSLDDLAVIAVLAGTPDDVRFWSEQVAPRTTTPIVAGVGRVSEDISRQYLEAPDGLEGLLVSIADASTYNQLLADQVLGDIVDPNAVPTDTPTPTLTPSLTPTLTPIGFVASDTPEGFVATDVPAGFEPYQVFGVGAFVTTTTGGAINVRGEPSTTAGVVGALGAQDVVIVQGEVENDNGELWTQILLPNGVQGWVTNELITPADEAQISRGQTQVAQLQPQTDTPIPTETATATLTPSVTETATATPTLTPTEVIATLVDDGVDSMVQEGTEETDSVESMVQEDTATPADEPTDVPELVIQPTDAPAEPTTVPTNTTVPSPTPVPDVLPADTVVITSPRTAINVRNGPGTEFERITSLRPNTRLLVIGSSDDGEWVETNLPDGQTGFIFRDLLSVDPEGEPPTLAPTVTPSETVAPPTETFTPTFTPSPIPLDAEGLVALVTSRRPVNVRTGPSRAFQAIGPLNPGQVVNILGATDDERWLEIQMPDGRTGFIIAGAAEVQLGATYLDQATATAQAGGEAELPPEPTLVPTLETDGTPGRTALQEGSFVQVRGFENVNVREEPARYSRVIGLIPAGDEVPARVLSADQRWVLVTLQNGLEGWVSRTAVLLEEPDIQPVTPTLSPVPSRTPTDAPATAILEEGAIAATEEAPPPVTEEVQSSRVMPRLMSRVQHQPVARVRATYQTDGSGRTRSADGSDIDLYEEPDDTSEMVGSVAPDTVVPVVAIDTSNGTWVQIRLEDGTLGFVNINNIVVMAFPSAESPLDAVATEEAATEDPSSTPADDLSEALDTTGEGRGTITGEGGVIVRSGPGEEFNEITTAPPDTEFAVRGFAVTDTGETWVRLRIDDSSVGYVNANNFTVVDFPTIDEPFEDTIASVAEEGSGTTIDEAEVRDGAGADFDLLQTIAPDVTLPVLGLEEGDNGETWVNVRLDDGTTGFINASSINVEIFPLSAQVTEEVAVAETNPTEEAVAQATEETVAQVRATEEPTQETTAEATEEATLVADAATGQAMRYGPFAVERAGEFEASLERQEFAVRLGLIVSAVIIGVGGLFNAFASRGRKK